MKIVNLTASFEGLKLENPIKAQAEATTIRSAVSRAFAAVLKAPELKSKRLTVINLSIDISNK